MINISHKHFEIVNDLLHRRFKSKYKKFLFFVKLLGRKCKVPRSNMKKVTIETRVCAVSRETKHEKSRVVYLRVLDNLWERKCQVPRSNMKQVTIKTRVCAVSRETKHEKSREYILEFWITQLLARLGNFF